MSVSVTDPRTEDNPPGSGRGRHTTYQVNVTTNVPAYAGSAEFAVRRRYNDFFQLYQGLGELARTKFTKLPGLPPKTSLVEGPWTLPRTWG